MTIHFANDAPQNGRDLVRARLLEIWADAGVRTVVFPHSLDLLDIDISNPMRVYNVQLDAFAQGQLISAATAYGWRYLLAGPYGFLAECEIVGKKNGPAVVTSFTSGPGAHGLVAAIDFFATNAKVPQGDYEMRVVTAPGAVVLAAWFHGAAIDRFVAIPPTIGLPLITLLEEGDIVGPLHASAKKALAAQVAQPLGELRIG